MGTRWDRLRSELRRRKVVRSAGWYLGVAFVTMQVVEVVLPYARLPESVGTAVLVALIAGFPVALALSWAFEVTPPALRREITSPTANGSVGTMPAPGRPIRADAVAVLPFQNLSDDPSDGYFSDGITDDLITSIAHIDGLRVLSRTSSMAYRETTLPLRDVAEQLGVATVVTGSVRRRGGRVRVVAEVVDARSDNHLWADTYDRDLQDIFEVQSEIAAEIALVVERELSAADRRRIEVRGTNDPEAYDLYLRARYLWNKRSEASVMECIRYYRRALERDARFAQAHAGLADAHAVLALYGIVHPREAGEQARSHAEAALAIEPDLEEALTVRACVAGICDWDWEAAEQGFRRVLATSRSYATAHQWYASNLLAPLGRFEEAHHQLEQARALDPASATIAVSRAIVRFYERDMDRAGAELEELIGTHPGFALAHLFLGRARQCAGDVDGALAALRRAIEVGEESSETLSAFAYGLATAGRVNEAEQILQRLVERAARQYVSPALRAEVLLGLGRHDEALDSLEEAVRVRATDLAWLKVRPSYDPLRASPRFETLLSTVGLERGQV